MKKVLFIVAVLFSLNNLNAQITEGTIYYERKQNMHRTLPNEQMKAMMPEFNTSEHILLFKGNSSLYKKSPVDELPDATPMGGGGGPVIMRMNGGPANDIVFKNYNTQEKIVEKSFFGKDYLIVDSVKNRTWKLTDETKKILGFTCRKATTTILQPKGKMMVSFMSSENGADSTKKKSENEIKAKEVEVVAWFCEQINISSGPEDYGSLPGMILEIEIDNGSTTFTAVEVKKKLEKGEFVVPTKGIKMTQKEFEAESKKIMDDIKINGGFGGGTFKIGGN